jgi:hypothetical protein
LCRLTDFTLRNLGIATAWIEKDRDCCSFWNELAQQLQAFGDDRSSEKRYTSDVTAGPIKTGNEAVFYGVRAVCKDDRDGGGFGLRCERGWVATACENCSDPLSNQLVYKGWQTIEVIVRPDIR